MARPSVTVRRAVDWGSVRVLEGEGRGASAAVGNNRGARGGGRRRGLEAVSVLVRAIKDGMYLARGRKGEVHRYARVGGRAGSFGQQTLGRVGVCWCFIRHHHRLRLVADFAVADASAPTISITDTYEFIFSLCLRSLIIDCGPPSRPR